MPGYVDHCKVNMVINTAILIPVILITNDYYMAEVGFLVSTFLMSPDLDTKNQMVKYWGIWGWWWKVYDKLFSHRVKGKTIWKESDIKRGVSHSIIFGTLTRLIWVSPIVAVYLMAIYYIKISFNVLNVFIVANFQGWNQLGHFALGCYLADFFHVTMDRTIKGNIK